MSVEFQSYETTLSPFSWLWDSMRSGGKTSYCFVNRGPGMILPQCFTIRHVFESIILSYDRECFSRLILSNIINEIHTIVHNLLEHLYRGENGPTQGVKSRWVLAWQQNKAIFMFFMRISRFHWNLLTLLVWYMGYSMNTIVVNTMHADDRDPCITAVLKIRRPVKIGHLVNSCIYYAHWTHEIYHIMPYSMDFKAPRELWNPLSKAVLSKCSFISDKGPVNIWNDHKAQK